MLTQLLQLAQTTQPTTASTVTTWLLLIGAIVSPIAVVVGKWMWLRRKGKDTDRSFDQKTGLSLRDELRQDLERLRADLKEQQGRIDGLQKQLDAWKSRYFDLRHAYNNAKNRYKMLALVVVGLKVQIEQKGVQGVEFPDLVDGIEDMEIPSDPEFDTELSRLGKYPHKP